MCPVAKCLLPKPETGCKLVQDGKTDADGCLVELCGKLVCKLEAQDCTAEEFKHDEGPTGNKCKTSCDCDGARTCSKYGWCYGTSRTVTDPVPEVEI